MAHQFANAPSCLADVRQNIPTPALKLLVVTHYFPDHGGGIELVAEQLASCFAGLGMQVHWLSSDTDAIPLIQQKGVTFEPIPASNIIERHTQLPYPLWHISAIRTLWRAIGAADIVHVHEHIYACSLMTLVIAQLRRRPVVITQHMGALWLRGRWLTFIFNCISRGLARLAFAVATNTVFISDNVRHFFRRQRDPNARIIFNGVDTERFHPPSQRERESARVRLGLREDQQIVLFVGRFVKKKGLRIIERLAHYFPDVVWLLVGSGPEQPAGHANVRVIGRIDNDKLPQFYQASDLLLLPSAGEGLPLVVQEALCCGLGVLSTTEVATACPVAADLMRTCILPKGVDAASAWKAALALALADTAYLIDRDRRARKARHLWSWHDCGNQYTALFSSIRTARNAGNSLKI